MEGNEQYASAGLESRPYGSAGACRPMRNTISGNEGRGFQKIVVDASTDRVLGMHMVGPECAEIMQVGGPLLLCLQEVHNAGEVEAGTVPRMKGSTVLVEVL